MEMGKEFAALSERVDGKYRVLAEEMFQKEMADSRARFDRIHRKWAVDLRRQGKSAEEIQKETEWYTFDEEGIAERNIGRVIDKIQKLTKEQRKAEAYQKYYERRD